MSIPLATVQHGHVTLPIQVGSPEWFTWLERTDAFTVEESGISFIAHRLYRGTSALWLAFCAIEHEVRWTVLGSTAELTQERLQSVASHLANWNSDTPEFPFDMSRDIASMPHLPIASPDLLVTKLEMPSIGATTLVRTRALDRLERALDYPLIAVSAPSGYGKTTLLAEWASETPARVAWLLLDENDNDPVRFCTHLLAALDRVVPGVLDAGLPYAQNAQVHLSDVSLLSRVINSLATTEGHIALVLDDYHAISPDNAAIHDAMLFFVEHLPSQAHVILSGRTSVPLRVSKLRVQRRLLELRIEDLRFTEDEARVFLERCTEDDIGREVSARIHARTEGWIAGLQLAARAIDEDLTSADSLVDHMSEHRYVVDFLADEVLQRLPREVGENVLRMAALDQFNMALCDALPGMVDSQTTLEILERENAFLVPLDDPHGWYRFHGLFGEVLRKRFLQTRREEAAELYHQASVWYENNGAPDMAVHYALHAGDEQAVVRIVRDILAQLRASGYSSPTDWTALEQSLDALPAPVIRRHPRLCLAQAQMLIQFGDLGESEEWLDDALALVSQGIAMDDEVEAANGATLIMDEIAQAHNTIIQSRQDRPSVERGADPLSLPAVTAHMRGQGAHTPITMPRHTETRHSSIAPGEVPIVFESLSAREMEVLQLLAEGESNQEIAHDLVIAVATVKRHLGNIFRKLAAQSRTQAVARARALQLLHDQPATPALTPPLFQGDHQAREIRQQRHGLSWRGYPRPSTNGNGNGSIAPGFA